MTLALPQVSSNSGWLGPLRWHWQAHPAGTAAQPRVRAWLATQLQIEPGALALSRDHRGRPRLDPPHERHDCNWSHSGGGLLIALGHDVRLGVDLEYIRPRPRALALAERYFSPAEAAWLRGMHEADREFAFLRLWCAKEAVLKAHGHGLSFGLHRLRLESRAGALRLAACDPALGGPAAWSLHEFAPASGYLAALAWRAR